MTDEISVECLTMNDLSFKGSLTFDEMRNRIPTEVLGLDQNLVHAVVSAFDGCQVVKLTVSDVWMTSLMTS